VSQQCPQTQIVNVADREADMYDIFLEAQGGADVSGAADVHRDADVPGGVRVRQEKRTTTADASRQTDFVIRAKEDRCSTERVPPSEHGTRYAVYRKARDHVRDSPLRARETSMLPRTPKRAARQAVVEIRAKSVTLKHPKNRPGLASVTCNLVHVIEIDGPTDGTAPTDEPGIEWWLITSLPVESLEDISRVIDYYKARWTIEVYFRVLKTGCRVEEMQLETTARAKACLAFYQIIAWRVLSLTHLNREYPSLPCTAVFADHEWQPAWRVTTKQELPDKVPKLSEFIRLLASLGGYNNRRTEAPPGPQPILVGIRRMSDFAQAWQSFGPTTTTYA
jgi:hypothetical protein